MTPRTMTAEREAEMKAAFASDWMQVVLNQGPPCFHLDQDGSFCFRAKRWDGHGLKEFHPFVSLLELLEKRTLAERAVSKALADALRTCREYVEHDGCVTIADNALAQYAASFPEKETNLEPR